MCVCMLLSLVRGGLPESPERVNGIRLTCVIQLGCGREVCPHPSAAGDKEPGEGRWGHFIMLLRILKKKINLFVCHGQISAEALILARGLQCGINRESTS